MNRLRAILGGRCPRCREGRVFRGQFAMNERCPSCGFTFEREPGYFTGAMYVSYVLAVPLLAGLTLLVWLITRWPLEWVLALACLLCLPTIPAIFRYSRILWLHFNWLVEGES